MNAFYVSIGLYLSFDSTMVEIRKNFWGKWEIKAKPNQELETSGDIKYQNN